MRSVAVLLQWITLGALLLANSSACEETITIEGRLQYPDKTPFNSTTRITINNGDYSTYSRPDGNFTFHDLTPGIYVIDVHCPTHHFAQVRCQFKPEAIKEGKPIFGCLEYVYPGANKRAVETMLVVNALATYQYFETQRGFSIFSIIKNPMVIMMLFTVGLMYYMPKMLEGLEPEERERMKKQMEMQQNPTQMLGELFGGLGGGETDPERPKRKLKK